MTAPPKCAHARLECLNPFEYIRKYRCGDCAAVMMCVCDEARGRQFLPHQLDKGVELETQARVPVTAGFQPKVCQECRGLPVDSAPLAEIYRRKGKIQRYYWRELFFMTEERVADWAKANGGRNESSERDRIEKEVLAELQQLHRSSPKYRFTELSQDEVIKRYGVRVDRIDARYLTEGRKGRVIDDGGEGCGVEDYVAAQYALEGWRSLRLESAPFHVLFGVYMWLLIQDATDEKVRAVGFGERSEYEERGEHRGLWTLLPEDFGGSVYAKRRAKEITEHLALIAPDRQDLLELFDLWREPSAALRNYLWAHREDDVARARRVVELLPAPLIVTALQYLLDHYWERFCGWPDLLLYRDDGAYFLAEVKSSGDKLSGDQKRWIADNGSQLKLPFRLIKVHRAGL